MADITCQYRTIGPNQIPRCQIVADLTELPLEVCHTNDSACAFCLKCKDAPQSPNHAVASMAHHAAERVDERDRAVFQSRIAPHIGRHTKEKLQQNGPLLPTITLENTPCVFRNKQIREQPCKPCQAGSLTPVNVPVYRCNSGKHSECTLRNTGTTPKIQACATCEDRLTEYPKVPARTYPADVLTILNQPGKGVSTARDPQSTPSPG